MHSDFGRFSQRFQGNVEDTHATRLDQPALRAKTSSVQRATLTRWRAFAAPSATIDTCKEHPGSSLLSSPGDRLEAAGNSAEPSENEGPKALRPSQAPHVLGTRSYLREIYIKDFALISEQRLALQPGFNVVSGESGAGKSVLVSALGLVLGANAPVNCIRAPAQAALLEGRVHLDPLMMETARSFLKAQNVSPKALGDSPSSGGEILLRREILHGDREGSVRSRSFVNGVAVSQRVLRELGGILVDVNGQQAAQSLREQGTQISLLDRLAGTSGIAAEFGAGLMQLEHARSELRALDELGDELARQDLQNMVDKIQSHGIHPGEEKGLKRDIRELDSRRANVE